LHQPRFPLEIAGDFSPFQKSYLTWEVVVFGAGNPTFSIPPSFHGWIFPTKKTRGKKIWEDTFLMQTSNPTIIRLMEEILHQLGCK